MKPVVLPMLHLLGLWGLGALKPSLNKHCEGRARNIRLLTSAHAQHAFEFVRENLDEPRNHVVPVVENPLGTATGSQLRVAQQEIFDDHHIGLVEQGLQIDGLQVTSPLGKVSALVEDVGHTAAHAGCEISATGAEHQHDAVGHVLASVVANALDHRSRSGVTNGKALARYSVEKRFAARGAVESNIADDDIFFRRESGGARRKHDEPAAGETLANVVVGLALKRKRDPPGKKRAQTLPRRALEVNADRVVEQSSRAVTARDFAA